MVTVILGVGNEIKSDDGVGSYIVNKLKNQNSNLKRGFQIFNAGTTPENFSGEIKRLKPDKLIIIDAADFRGFPGESREIEPEQIKLISFSTHNFTLKVFIDYLKADLPNMAVQVIGIQPKILGFGEKLSPEVQATADKICQTILV
ncbi:hydrogenase maturation peptidase HycI [candidate division WOR-1 bacterium RIFOXYB2_FULL_48_7]|uniref:Hydrogenase maturation peptidase HycI n=1 Tax=candidate division WOR-1 bacterium RIFOXYB2_FULL_48_7 TaxID=1802583 RepID=A0A1F4T9L3_UNCSA|nr:MAG: hydrogenase maturation peptidase HycI [candidate division WOR-1 bacterium RIFOXYB2_FULL_48_7]